MVGLKTGILGVVLPCQRLRVHQVRGGQMMPSNGRPSSGHMQPKASTPGYAVRRNHVATQRASAVMWTRRTEQTNLLILTASQDVPKSAPGDACPMRAQSSVGAYHNNLNFHASRMNISNMRFGTHTTHHILIDMGKIPVHLPLFLSLSPHQWPYQSNQMRLKRQTWIARDRLGQTRLH